jgi:hypothetical protein
MCENLDPNDSYETTLVVLAAVAIVVVGLQSTSDLNSFNGLSSVEHTE